MAREDVTEKLFRRGFLSMVGDCHFLTETGEKHLEKWVEHFWCAAKAYGTHDETYEKARVQGLLPQPVVVVGER